MSIINLVLVAAFIKSRRHLNNPTFDYRTCRPIPKGVQTHRWHTMSPAPQVVVPRDADARRVSSLKGISLINCVDGLKKM